MNDNRHIELWDKCRLIIKDNLPREQYDAWFRDIVSLSFVDSKLTLSVPSPFFAQQLDEKYITLLAPALRRVYGNGVKLFYQYNQVNGMPDTSVNQLSSNPSPVIAQQQKPGISDPFQAPAQGEINSQLNPKYTFENYCGGESNKIAKSIAQALADDPANNTFNPLFIYGSVGVGKTHLMQAIGIRLKEKNARMRVLYVTARLFESQYTFAVSKKTTNNFYKFYQNIDALLIDDIQDLQSKPGTQNIFYHIFNHLRQNNKIIIMSSDRAPIDMEGFEDRMLSRFKGGVAVELERPDIELRRSVLAQKAMQDGLDLPDDVKEFIATNVCASIRDLEGVMASLVAYAAALNCPITLDLARKITGKTVKVSTRPVNFEMIAHQVTAYYNLKDDALFTKSRKREISDARQILMYLARKVARIPLVEIGKLLQRTHATVNYACNTIEERLTADLQLQNDISNIEAAVAADCRNSR